MEFGSPDWTICSLSAAPMTLRSSARRGSAAADAARRSFSFGRWIGTVHGLFVCRAESMEEAVKYATMAWHASGAWLFAVREQMLDEGISVVNAALARAAASGASDEGDPAVSTAQARRNPWFVFPGSTSLTTWRTPSESPGAASSLVRSGDRLREAGDHRLPAGVVALAYGRAVGAVLPARVD
jgi:hypothetical protein